MKLIFKYISIKDQFSSVAQSCPTLRYHGLQHSRLPCPSATPRARSNSSPSSRWCHPTISSCHPLLLLPSIFPSIRVFSNESVLPIRWRKYWHFSFNTSPSNEYSGLVSFRMDWFSLLAVQGTQKSSKPQFKSISSSALSFLYSPTVADRESQYIVMRKHPMNSVFLNQLQS